MDTICRGLTLHVRHLVSGGTGFIGSHLIDHLMSDDSNRVICIDDCNIRSKRNIAHWLSNPRFEFIQDNICNCPYLDVDKIWHLAACDSSSRLPIDPIAITKSTISGTLCLLELAKNTNAEFLLASSSDVYGNPQVVCQAEDYFGNVNPIGIRACFQEGKRVAESLCFDYKRTHSLTIHIARLFDSYGPRMIPENQHVVSNFICQLLNHKPIFITGDGSQIRSFCYIKDLISGIVYLMNSNHSGPINLGNPDPISISLLAHVIASSLSPPVSIIFLPSTDDEARSLCPSIELARTLLNWQPLTALENGLIDTISDLQSQQFNKIYHDSAS